MRFHVVSLPHTHTTVEFSSCAYTQKVRRFCRMMKGYSDNEVILYSGEENDALCDEHVVCISETDRQRMLGDGHYTQVDWNHPMWNDYNRDVRAQLNAPRLKRGDIICIIAGNAQRVLGEAFPDRAVVEFGVGYSGVFSKYRVFESYAWMHMVYGRDHGPRDLNAVEGQWLDAVIPNQIEPELFPFSATKHNYLLYIGRMVDLKGYKIAQEVAELLHFELILAGPGNGHGYGKFIGEVGPEHRAELMRHARAVFVPTRYVEPFGTVAIEAMASGTPVITTDWGAFTETVLDGATGFRCRSFAEFVAAVHNSEKLDPVAIREYAVNRFGVDTVAKQYRDYFSRLQTVLEKGWYAL